MREAARIQVVEPGLSTVQDLGRADGPRSGQMAGGALDQYSARMANTLVASDPDAALLELVALDFAATTDADLLVAVTGADADVTVDGHPQPQWEPVVWRAGTRLAVRRIRSGLRVYLAVHGTVHTRRLLGSCAPDTVLGFGAPLGADAVLTVAVDCPPVVQPWFDIPFFRLGARPHPYSGRVERRPDRRPGRRRVRPDRGAAHRRRLRRRRPQQPHRAAPAPRRPRAAARPRGRDRGAVPRRADRRGRGARRRRAAGAAPRARRHRGLPGARRRHQRGAVPPRAGPPGDTVRFRHVTCAAAIADYRRQQAHLAEIRARVQTVYTSLGIPLHFTDRHFTDQHGHPPARPPPRRPLAPGVSVTTSTAHRGHSQHTDRRTPERRQGRGRGLRRHLRRAVRQRHLRLHGHRAGHRLLRRDQPEQRDRARVRRLRHLVLRPAARRDRLRDPRRPDRAPAPPGLRHRADQRGHRGHRRSCPPTRPSASPPRSCWSRCASRRASRSAARRRAR